MTRAGRNADSERIVFFNDEWKRCCLKHHCGHAASMFMKLAKSLCGTQEIRKSRTVRFKNLLFAIAALLLVHQSAMWKKIDQGQAPTISELQLENLPLTVCNHSWWPATTTCGRTTSRVLMLATHVVVHASHVWNEKNPQWSKQVAKTPPREKLATPSIEYNENEPNLEMEMALRKTSFIWAKGSWEFLLVYHQTISTKSRNEYKV